MHELERLSGPELSLLLAAGLTTVVVPFGSVEYHGAHLPLGSDALLADAVGREVAERLDAVLAPTQRIGDADAHLNRPGTLSVGAATLAELALAVAYSLARQGFRLIVLVSTHGGNSAGVRNAVQRFDWSGSTLCAPSGDVGPDPGAHSGEWLTSVMLALHPELVEIARAEPELTGELRNAGAERGRAHLERFVASIVSAVRS
jgi:creatinine amidohydrolase